MNHVFTFLLHLRYRSKSPATIGSALAGVLLVTSCHSPGANPSASINILEHPFPIYPTMARAACLHDTIPTTLTLAASGDVVDVLIDRPDGILKSVAREAAMKWRFESTSEASPRSITITFSFRLLRPGSTSEKRGGTFLSPLWVEVRAFGDVNCYH